MACQVLIAQAQRLMESGKLAEANDRTAQARHFLEAYEFSMPIRRLTRCRTARVAC